MTQFACCQHQCWLESFFISEIDYPPLFCLGQPVKTLFIGEEGFTFIDRGIVIGLVPNPEWWCKPGWVYWVKWIDLPSSPYLPLPCCDEIHESDLQPDKGSDA